MSLSRVIRLIREEYSHRAPKCARSAHEEATYCVYGSLHSVPLDRRRGEDCEKSRSSRRRKTRSSRMRSGEAVFAIDFVHDRGLRQAKLVAKQCKRRAKSARRARRCVK